MKLAAFVLVVISAVMLLVTALPADENKIALCLSYGAFTPIDSSTRDLYSDSLSRFAITTFQPEVPRKWRFTAETGSLKFGGVNSDVRLIPITAGIQKGFGDKWNCQPYLALRTGPCYTKVDVFAGDDDTSIKWNANAAYGLIYKRRYYIEARYDYFTKVAGNDFSGFSLSIGTRILGISL